MSGPMMLLWAVVWIVLFGGFFAAVAAKGRKREDKLRREMERAAIISDNRKRLVREWINY